MSKRRNKKDKQKARSTAKPAATATPAQPKVAKPKATYNQPANKSARPLTFGPDTYKWMGIGFALVLIGLLLMSGSRGDEFAEFDESYIYGFRRITLAPIVILGGIGTVAYAILKK
ncbi:MAG: DUF3098 domain-containing protein [Bacteroidota bacterium]